MDYEIAGPLLRHVYAVFKNHFSYIIQMKVIIQRISSPKKYKVMDILVSHDT